MKDTSKLFVTCASVGMCIFLLVALTSTSAARNWTKLSPTQPTARITAKNASAKISEATTKQVIEAYGRLPLSFEANKGQTDGQVKFLSRGSGYTLFLTPSETVLVLRKLVSPKKQHNTDARPAVNVADTRSRAVLRMQLLGANSMPEVVGLEKLPGKSHYFIGNDPHKWPSNIPNYAKVQYKSIYPGIDLIYYGNQRQLEYDFVVGPGADPSVIRFGFEGADTSTFDAQGNLILDTTGGKVILHAPVIYQEIDGIKQVIPGRFQLQEDNQVSFQVASFDAGIPLIIDPVLSYSTYLGGSVGDFANGIAVAIDASGNAYVTGETLSTDFPTASPFQASSGGGLDAFVTKLNSTGDTLIYSTYLGGSDLDRGREIAVDTAGNAYVTGETVSTNFPTASPFQASLGGGGDAFVTKLNAIGSALVYSTYLGGSSDDGGNGISVDTNGNAYVTGATFSINFPTASPIQASLGGGRDTFVTKLNTSGSALVYSTYLGGSGSDTGSGIAVDANDNAYVAGTTGSTDFPTASPIQAALGGGSDAFVTKVNSLGTALDYSTYLGGSGNEISGGIAVDTAGNAYETGITTSTDFPTANPFQASLDGVADAYVTKVNALGTALAHSTYLGGSGFESGAAIAADSAGNAYVTGETGSSDFPTVDPIQAFKGGGNDAFVTTLNAAGDTLIFSTFLGGGANDRGRGITLDTNRNAYVTGQTQSSDFPTVNPFQATLGGGTDAFVAKIADIQPPGGLEHFTGYDVKPEAVIGGGGMGGNELNIDVTLTDEFGTSLLTVKKAKRLLTPVDKNGEGIGDEVSHLTCYDLKSPLDGSTGVVPNVDVAVVNQFNALVGDQIMNVGELKTLCVPSTKTIIGDPPAGGAVNSEHFTGYNVTPDPVIGGGGMGGNELSIDVTLTDQFGTSLLTVKKAKRLLVPVDKNGEGIVDAMNHLVCYDLGNPLGGMGTGVNLNVDVEVDNQFNSVVGAQVMNVGKLKVLCVPSTKELVP